MIVFSFFAMDVVILTFEVIIYSFFFFLISYQ